MVVKIIQTVSIVSKLSISFMVTFYYHVFIVSIFSFKLFKKSVNITAFHKHKYIYLHFLLIYHKGWTKKARLKLILQLEYWIKSIFRLQFTLKRNMSSEQVIFFLLTFFVGGIRLLVLVNIGDGSTRNKRF